MCDKAILENGGTLKSVADCYKNIRKMRDKAVDNYPHTLEFLPECYETQEICNKASNKWFLYLIVILIVIKLKKFVAELFLKMLF